jgi:hypothetical protein
LQMTPAISVSVVWGRSQATLCVFRLVRGGS